MIDSKCPGELRPMAVSDISTVLMWRNHPSIRKWMYSNQEISIEAHNKWFESSRNDPSKTLLIYTEADIPLGFLNFKAINSERIAEWGFYTSPEAPKGTGRHMGICGLNYAFIRRNFHRVFATVLDFNVRSVTYHERLGFSKEGILRSHHFDGKIYRNVYLFGLLKDEWSALNPLAQTQR